MFRKLKDTVKERLDEQRQNFAQHQQQQQPQQHLYPHQQQGNTGPSQPPPAGSGSGGLSSPCYWKATLDPNIPISHDWRYETGASGWGNNELQDYTTDERNSSIRTIAGAGGQQSHALSLRVVVDDQQRITSARLTSHQSLARDRGYLVARITAPSAKGIWPAFWLLPTEPFRWPEDGEVDIFETWNGSPINHSCLHWGHYVPQDNDKHRVIDTHVDNLSLPQGHTYGFAWDGSSGSGSMVWYIDERPVMRAQVPQGMRPLRDFQVKLNIAVGGNVMQGVRPDQGVYEMLVHEMALCDAPPGGWQAFERDRATTVEGRGY